jgi:hypothetical protein
MEIAEAFWQLCSAMLIFAGYLLFFVFVAPFSYRIASFVSARNSLRGRSYLSATIAVFTRNPSGDVGLRDLDRSSLVDFRKPRSIPLNALKQTGRLPASQIPSRTSQDLRPWIELLAAP